MSQLEDEIRESLRSEADRLREVRPLRLPAPAASRWRRAPRASQVRWQRPWLAPVAAAAVIVLIAAGLVTAKVLTNGGGGSVTDPATALASSDAPSATGPVTDVTPRYYVGFGWVADNEHDPGDGNSAIVVHDVRTGKALGSYNLPKGGSLVWSASGAADDRTFVVAAATTASVFGPARFYLVRVFPGTADPVRVTPLGIQPTSATSIATQVTSIALSADGTELAVVLNTGKSVGLGVYSVATGRLQRFWSAAISGVSRVSTPVTDPSWVGDATVGFAFIDTPNVREDVRTLSVSSAGTSLLAGSHVVWSQQVAYSQLVPKASAGTPAAHPPQTCDTPFLTGNGQAVVCASSSYSAATKRLTARWLAYPLAAPASPRVIGSVTEPADVTGFNGANTVDWVNSSGTEVIGAWNPAVQVTRHGVPATSVTNDLAFIGGGQVRQFPWGPGVEDAAW
jgi:hypothetical protein